MGEPCDYFISLIVALNACFALSGVNKSVFGINKIIYLSTNTATPPRRCASDRASVQ